MRRWKTGKPKFSKATLRRIISERMKGEKLTKLAKKYRIHYSYISKLVNATDNCGGHRHRVLPKNLRLKVLNAAMRKHISHIMRIRREISLIEGK